jgi:2-C-methyl-D-erythritol 4-phosphate cytidylyltransferase/2-C-methyl-D-erythritol 2,4-cyclodiphosphate synthase
MHVTAIVAAGGRGRRFGGAVPKQLLAVGGRSILERSVALFLAHSAIDEVVVALPAELLADPPSFLGSSEKPLHLVAGGARRQDSVISALEAANERSDVIVIHDAARPLATSDLVSRTIAAAAESGAAVAALAASDTVKRSARNPADGGSGELLVAETIPRESIFLAQTPQAFRRDVLRDALALAGTLVDEVTDEATLVERAGRPVRLVRGEATNIKITTPEDLQIAETIARGAGARPARTGRAGVGYDLHRLVEGRPLVLGGVNIPSGRGLLGHSDADAVCHAITDAILGAAAEGDIGRHFPDTDPAWHNASSVDLLRRAAQLLRDRGLEVGNVDASVIAERPRLTPYIDAMRANVAGALGVSASRVSIKAKTNEGVGELGRGEAIAVHAIALVRQSH